MEIAIPLDLTAEEESLVDMHSVLNVLNVVNLELLNIDQLLNTSEEIYPLMDKLQEAVDLLKNPQRTRDLVLGIDEFLAEMESSIDHIEAENGPDAKSKIIKHRENLRNIFAIIRIRAAEIQSRFDANDLWVEHSIQELKSRFEQFLQAVEQNSHGSYRIVKNLANKNDRDYLINFEITSDKEGNILMPIIFQDVMRDILANARKYTKPGGKITGGLHFGDDSLRFVIEDTGIGIPEDEIENVVRLGYRGRNVQDRPTRGGGFGLTKAYWVTKRHNGRMWIDSTPNGSRIEIRIPAPVSGN